MKKYIYLLLFVIFGSLCFAEPYISFTVPVGKQPSQLGYIEGDEFPIGPSAVTEYSDKVFILDKVNLRVNVYSIMGEYKNSISIPKGLNYYDIAVNSNGQILLLTNKGIIVRTKTSYKKLYDIPYLIRIPYYFSVNKKDILILNGLGIDGRVKSIMYNMNGNYKELDGYGVFFSYSGLLGLQISDTEFMIIKDNKIVDKIKINLSSITMTPIGFTDDLSLYCVEPEKQGIIVYKISKGGEIKKQEVAYSSELIEDPSDIIKFLKVTKKGEIVGLEVHEKECKVLRIKF